MNRRKLFQSILGVFAGAKIAPDVLAVAPKKPIPTKVNWTFGSDLWFQREANLLTSRMAEHKFRSAIEKGTFPEGMGFNYEKVSYLKTEPPAIQR